MADAPPAPAAGTPTEQQNDLGKTEKGQPQEPMPSRDATMVLRQAKAALHALAHGPKSGRPDYVGMLSSQDALALHAHVEALTNALADMVAKATDYGSQDGGFVAAYIIPTGPMHRAIPLLDNVGISVRPGYDGRKNASRVDSALAVDPSRSTPDTRSAASRAPAETSVMCRDCFALVGGVEAGAKVRWVVCESCR